jgi:hypothetical protein
MSACANPASNMKTNTRRGNLKPPPTLPARVREPLIKHPELVIKHPELVIKHPEQNKHPELRRRMRRLSSHSPNRRARTLSACLVFLC